MKVKASIVIFFFLILFEAHAQLDVKADSLKQMIDRVRQELQVDISYQPNVEDTWQSVKYDACSVQSMISYLDLLLKEYTKYPAGYFIKAGIHKFVLISNLKFNGQARAAVPDPY